MACRTKSTLPGRTLGSWAGGVLVRLTLGSLIACNLLWSSSSMAATAGASIRRPIDIPRQALAPALQSLIKASDVQLVYLAELVRDRVTDGARGELTSIE